MFSPYHQFAECKKLEKLCLQLNENGQLPPAIHDSFLRHHYSLRHKLRTAVHHITRLKEFIDRQKVQESEPVEIVYWVNFRFDGFTHAIGSALDIFAREVLVYYGHALPDKVYFYKAHLLIGQSHAGNPILSRIRVPSWRDEFGDYRNTATHECVVGLKYSGDFDVIGGVVQKEFLFPLPDDPRAAHNAKTYIKNRDIVVYCEQVLTRTLRLLNPAYKQIHDQGKAGGFPLP